MATYTSNFGWTKPSGSDNVDISVLNNNLDDQDSTIHDAFLNMAPPFSESSTYAVDDIVLYDTGLYKCHTAVVTPGSWTGSTNWQVYKLSEGGSGGGGTSNYNDLTNKPSINGVTLSGNKTTSDLGINADNVMLSDGVTSVEDALSTQRYVTIKSVTADGVKTYSELLNELSSYATFGCTLSIANNLFTSRNSNIYYNLHMTSGGAIQGFTARIASSGSLYKAITLGANGNTIEDLSSNVPNNGTIISLIKFL